jgi:AcrR family transcriptional regulator
MNSPLKLPTQPPMVPSPGTPQPAAKSPATEINAAAPILIAPSLPRFGRPYNKRSGGPLDNTNGRAIFIAMTKGEETRQAILDRAAVLASRIGLEALSIGKLAEELELSKSGLFAHFRSKEALQVQLLERAAERFVETVISPALKAPRGEKRIRALFERWRKWPEQNGLTGCLFVTAAVELDDQPCPARDVLVKQQRDWLDTLANVVRTAVDEGDFKKSLDPKDFAFELFGIMLAYHHSTRLLGDPKAKGRAEAAFEALISRAKK